jgi:hypothetical protein
LTSQSTYPPEDDEDTIELELTAKELRRLSRAARHRRTATSGFAHRAGKGLLRLWPAALAAALVGIAAAITWRPTPPQRVVPRLAPTPPISSTPAVSSTPVAPSQPAVLAKPPEPQRPPVRVRNPFDAREVFEFPAGTTQAEARQKVAQALLQRAVDRDVPATDH